MIMAGVGTFVAGRYVFRDGFEDAGWRWGRPRHYILAFGLALFLWVVPVVIEGSGAPRGLSVRPDHVAGGASAGLAALRRGGLSGALQEMQREAMRRASERSRR